MIKRVATSTVVIMSLIVVLVLVVVVAKTNFGKGKPPPGAAANTSLNDMLSQMSTQQMDPVVAGAEANAKRRAYEKQVALEKARRGRRRGKAEKAKALLRGRSASGRRSKSRMGSDPSAAENQAYAKKMNAPRGWCGCWASLQTMWNHESGWNEHADNPTSGAYGIPQALPGSKMASAGPDWDTTRGPRSPGASTTRARYGDPCKAWVFWQTNNWYRAAKKRAYRCGSFAATARTSSGSTLSTQ